MKKLVVLIVALTIATVALSLTTVHFHLKAQETPYCAILFKAEIIDKPDNYWSLTNPDKWILEAIEKPGKKVYCFDEDGAKQTFTEQVTAHHGVYNIEYKGVYYYITVMYLDFSVGTIPLAILEQAQESDRRNLRYSYVGLAMCVALLIVSCAWWAKHPSVRQGC